MTRSYDIPPRAIVDHDLRALSVDDLADIHEALVDLSRKRLLRAIEKGGNARLSLDACATVDDLTDRIADVGRRREDDHG